MSFGRVLKNLEHRAPDTFVDAQPSRAVFPIRDFNYPAQYFSAPGDGGAKIHFVDTLSGRYPRTALCLHGRYGWSYSYRNVIPRLAAHGYRVVAADLLGFGRSDKTDDPQAIETSRQCERLVALVEALDLERITLIGHEMGAGVAAVLAHALGDRTDAFIAVNPAGHMLGEGWPGFHLWRTLSNARQTLDIGGEVAAQCRGLEPHEQNAYNAPFQDGSGMLAVRRFHDRIVLSPDDPEYDTVETAYGWLRNETRIRCIVAAGEDDPVFGLIAAKRFRALIGAAEKLLVLRGVGPYPFEDDPSSIEEMVDLLFSA